MKVTLYGLESEKLRPLVEAQAPLCLVEDDPDVVVCFGGDGTLLAAELRWPSVPKVPLRNSRRGIRCIPDPPAEVLERLAADTLVRHQYLKLECSVIHKSPDEADHALMAINEFSVHKGRTNASVRFRIWVDEKPYGTGEDQEIIGDGFVVCTPFGSTAYFNQITRGMFWTGIGVAFMYTSDHTNHLVLPEDAVVRARITRGPAVLAHDNASEYIELNEGDELLVRRSQKSAVLLTPDEWGGFG